MNRVRKMFKKARSVLSGGTKEKKTEEPPNVDVRVRSVSARSLRARKRCRSRRSMVIGYNGFPRVPPAESSSSSNEEDPTEPGTSEPEYDYNITLPYRFSISTIAGPQTSMTTLSEGGEHGLGVPGPSSCHASLSGLTTECSRGRLHGRGNESMGDCSVGGLPQVGELQVGEPQARDAAERRQARRRRRDETRLSRFERLLGPYWMEQDYDGNTRMERWLECQSEATEHHIYMIEQRIPPSATPSR